MDITVADYISQFLKNKGIEDIFFIDGSAAASMIVSASKHGFNYYCPLHEQAGSFMVDGYYKTYGKMTAMIATSGPGGQNLINGIAASWYDSVPAFYLTGQINSRFLKPTNEIRQHGFQEHDIVSMIDGITKYSAIVTIANEIAYHLEKAYYLAISGRPGPVLLDIPMDIQKTIIDTDDLVHYIPEETDNSNEIIESQIKQCVEWVQASKRPAILVGGGVWLSKGTAECRQLIEVLQSPFFETWNMLDFSPNNDPLYGGRVGTFGGDGRNFGIQNCDLLICVGSRVSGRIVGGMLDAFAREAKKVIVDIDEKETQYQQVKADMNVNMDARLFCELLTKELLNTGYVPNHSDWIDKVYGWKNKYTVLREQTAVDKSIVNPYRFVKALSDSLNDGDIVIHEAGGNCVVTSQAFEAKVNQRVFTNNGNSSLGYSFPAAIGACIAAGKKSVVCIVGDGGFNFNIQELQTLKQYDLPVKIFIFNNQCYGITKAYRETNCNSEYAGVDKEHGVSSPDFIAVASAYKIDTETIANENELYKIKEVLDSPHPVLCDVNMNGFHEYLPRVGWRTPIEDMYPFIPRDEFIMNMIIEPLSDWENPQFP